MKNRIAVIDMGTNTFHILIAEGEGKDIEFLHQEKQFVRLGKGGGITDGTITSEAFERAMIALTAFKEVAEKYGAQTIKAVGTSAMRNAKNAQILIEKAKQELGIDIQVIDGQTEAEAIYAGVAHEVGIEPTSDLVMDIGGGSVEFIIGALGKIQWVKSFEIGAQRLLDKFYPSDPIPESSIKAMREYLQEELAELGVALMNIPVSRFIGSAGAFSTLRDLHNLHHRLPSSNMELLGNLLKPVYYDLQTLPRERRMQLPGMVEQRVDMMVLASILIEEVVKLTNIGRGDITTSRNALKEGIALQVLSNLDSSHKCNFCGGHGFASFLA